MKRKNSHVSLNDTKEEKRTFSSALTRMKVQDILSPCGFAVLAGKEGLDREIAGIYCCDLLSMVMGKAFPGCCWVTIMGNVNSIAVASLADAACIVFAESVRPDQAAMERAGALGIPLLQSDKPIFETALSVYQLTQAPE